MKKKVIILGSTGSIGSKTVEIFKKDKKNFEVLLLSTFSNVRKIIKQAKELNVKNIIINDFKKFPNSIPKKRAERLNLSKDFVTVTPGIRIEQDNNDQSRVATLDEAMKNGSDYIVLGREITSSKNISKMIKKVESYII